jgi:hypothetical protein
MAMRKVQLPPLFVFRKTDGLGHAKAGMRLRTSAEAVRCMLLACVAVLARHGKWPKAARVVVELTNDWVVDEADPKREELGGLAYACGSRMRVHLYHNHDDTLAIVLHEYLHLCGYDGGVVRRRPRRCASGPSSE